MKRPFRLEIRRPNERVARGFVEHLPTQTYATEQAARDMVPIFPGYSWKIVERRREMNAQGRPCTRLHVIAEGVVS